MNNKGLKYLKETVNLKKNPELTDFKKKHTEELLETKNTVETKNSVVNVNNKLDIGKKFGRREDKLIFFPECRKEGEKKEESMKNQLKDMNDQVKGFTIYLVRFPSGKERIGHS